MKKPRLQKGFSPSPEVIQIRRGRASIWIQLLGAPPAPPQCSFHWTVEEFTKWGEPMEKVLGPEDQSWFLSVVRLGQSITAPCLPTRAVTAS